jgi:hypothetical protein
MFKSIAYLLMQLVRIWLRLTLFFTTSIPALRQAIIPPSSE